MLDNKVAEIVAFAKHTPKITRIGEMKDDEDIPTDLKDIANATLNLMDDTQKALDFDKYTSQDQINGDDDNQLSPATADLKSRMANTPLKQSWEDAADNDAAASTAEEAMVPQNETGQNQAEETKLDDKQSAEEAAMAQTNENGQNASEENNLHESTAPEHTSTNQQGNPNSTTNVDNAQENPTSTTNSSHYTLGFEGDESSTN
eukprot:scaffold19352_cov23-Cyclotella_meneghiniana.AAC.1